jgi:hypothetical protein
MSGIKHVTAQRSAPSSFQASSTLPALLAGAVITRGPQKELNKKLNDLGGRFMQKYGPAFESRASLEHTMQKMFDIFWLSDRSRRPWLAERLDRTFRALAANKIVNNFHHNFIEFPQPAQYFNRLAKTPKDYQYFSDVRLAHAPESYYTKALSANINHDFVLLGNNLREFRAHDITGTGFLVTKSQLTRNPYLSSNPPNRAWQKNIPPFVSAEHIEGLLESYAAKGNTSSGLNFVFLDQPGGSYYIDRAHGNTFGAFQRYALQKARELKIHDKINFSTIEIGGEELRRAVDLVLPRNPESFADDFSRLPKEAKRFLIDTARKRDEWGEMLLWGPANNVESDDWARGKKLEGGTVEEWPFNGRTWKEFESIKDKSNPRVYFSGIEIARVPIHSGSMRSSPARFGMLVAEHGESQTAFGERIQNGIRLTQIKMASTRAEQIEKTITASGSIGVISSELKYCEPALNAEAKLSQLGRGTKLFSRFGLIAGGLGSIALLGFGGLIAANTLNSMYQAYARGGRGYGWNMFGELGKGGIDAVKFGASASLLGLLDLNGRVTEKYAGIAKSYLDERIEKLKQPQKHLELNGATWA